MEQHPKAARKILAKPVYNSVDLSRGNLVKPAVKLTSGIGGHPVDI